MKDIIKFILFGILIGAIFWGVFWFYFQLFSGFVRLSAVGVIMLILLGTITQQ